MRWALLTAVVIILCAAPAHADDAQDRFDRATGFMADERFAEAVEAFVAIADTSPDGRFADDALLSAGQLLEERLGDPARAADIYARLVADYPDSRTALAAKRRLDRLRASMGADGKGAQPLARYTEILHNRSERSAKDSIALMEQLVAEHPEWPGVARAFLWLGSAHASAGNTSLAIDWYLRAAKGSAEGDVVYDGYRGAGDVSLRAGNFDDAERYFRLMPIEGDSSRRRGLDEALVLVGRERLRARLYQLSFAAVVLVLLGLVMSARRGAGSWAATGRALVRPPTEVIYLAPLAAVLVAAAYTGHEQIGPAVTIIAAGGLVVTWLSGAALQAGGATRGRVRPLLHMGASVLAGVAICYIAVHRTRLVDLIIATVRFGPDV